MVVNDVLPLHVLAQEPHQRNGAAAAGEGGFAETAEEMVVRQGPVCCGVRQQGLNIQLFH